MYKKGLLILAISTTLGLTTCTWDKSPPDYKGYPDNIGAIMLTKCAIPGCHNDISKDAAGGLSLTSWDKLFEGTVDNAAVVPYRPDQSFLMFFINTYPDLGQTLTPVMPYNASPLTKQEVIDIQDWISNGAPDKDGFVKFSDNAETRSKIYITNQGCDLVTVMDRETKLIMRYFDIGSQPVTESPHKSIISNDGFFYVCFYASNIFQKYSTIDETLVGEVDLGLGSWNTFVITSDSKKAFVIDWNASGTIAVVDLENMAILVTYGGSGLLAWPHGSALKNDSTLYVTAQTGNFIYKIDVSDIHSPDFTQIVLQTGEAPTETSSYDPHDIRFSPDKSEYAITCQTSNEIRFFNAENDSLVAVVPTGKFPQELEFSTNTDYLFVTCTEDDVTYSGTIGSVTVINYKTHTFVKSIYTGYQPHGIAVDDEKGLVYVANRNANLNGPAPHHATDCGGRNGYLTIIDINTLELIPDYKAELSVDPYYISIRE